MSLESCGKVYASKKSKRTFNPIRNIVDNLKPPSIHAKKLLNLALGDPTVHGNLECPVVLMEAVQESLSRGAANGYMPSTGWPPAKRAIASYSSRSEYSVTEDDVIIASGCSGALELAISSLMDEGDNILVPKPGFPLYEVISNSLGGSVKHYILLSHQHWEADVPDVESLIDRNTRAILISNPSNPCGSNYSPHHLSLLVDVARRHSLPIIADEIYGNCVFDGEFCPLITLCRGEMGQQPVPLLTVGGLAKQFIVPGWRVGWVILSDYGTEALSDVRSGIKSLTQIIVGSNSLIQSAIPRVLDAYAQAALQLKSQDSSGSSLFSGDIDSTNKFGSSHAVTSSNGSSILTAAFPNRDVVSMRKFHERYMDILKTNARLCSELARDIPQLSVVQPSGAMYCMIQIDMSQLKDISDDADFASKLLTEQNVIVLPGKCFGQSGFIRLVICPPPETIVDAFSRIRIFCDDHRPISISHTTSDDTILDSSTQQGQALKRQKL